MIFETHAHYEDKAFQEDQKELLSGFANAGIEYVVNVGSSMNTSRQSITLSDAYDFIYVAVGAHPDHVEELNDEALNQLGAWCHLPKVVAIGEIGLDYYYEDPVRDIQKYWFQKQLEVACKEHMPIIVHSRDAAEDTFSILQQYKNEGLTGIIHCFGYSKEMAREFIKLGYVIGVGGVVTFKNAKRLVEVVEDIELSHIVLETDCPYMAPVPHRGKRNSSLLIPHIAEKIAEIKQVSVEEVYRQTMENAKRVYRIQE